MALQLLSDLWTDFNSRGDPRVNDYMFMSDPIIVLCIIAIYLLAVWIGPKIMKHRQPLQLRNVLIMYNLCHVNFSMWMTREFICCTLLNPGFDLLCEPVVKSDTSPATMRLINVHWWYFFSKIVEFLDTMFFIVRKKDSQITFLHVYHHVGVLCLTWGNVKFVPGAISYFGPLLNCFVHSVMYTYYMLSAFGPHMQKYLWWKRYITQMQMTQFTVMIVFLANVIRRECIWRVFCWTMVVYLASMLVLFGHFYRKAFLERQRLKKEQKKVQ